MVDGRLLLEAIYIFSHRFSCLISAIVSVVMKYSTFILKILKKVWEKVISLVVFLTPVPALKDPFFDDKKTDKDDPLLREGFIEKKI